MKVENKQRLALVSIMILVALSVGGISLNALYDEHFRDHKNELIHIVESRANFIEAVARFDKKYSSNYPGGTREATISQIRDSHKKFVGIRKTGEFLLGEKKGDNIIFLLTPRHQHTTLSIRVSMAGSQAEPMRRAIKGESGTIIAQDYRGVEVLAAYQDVDELNLGLVAKIDISEINEPFYEAGILVGVGGLIVILIGTIAFFKVSDPLVQSIREKEDQLDSVLEGAEVYFWDWNVQTDEVIFDPLWIKFLGYSQDEVKPTFQQCKEWVHLDDLPSVIKILNAHIQGKSKFIDIEYRALKKSGEWIWVLDRGKVLKWDNDGKPLQAYGTFQNIQDRKDAELEIAEAQKQLISAQKLAGIGELTAGVSHEVLNPVNIISVSTQMLQKKVKDNPYIQNFCSKTRHEIDRIQKIMGSLLEFSRRGKVELEKGHMRTAIEKVLSLVEEEYKLDNIEIKRDWCDTLVDISYDADKIRQVYLNLLNNAKHSMPDGGTITVGCKAVEGNKKYHQFTFSDTGTGMSEQTRLRIFEPFFTTKPEGEGSGLGLSVAYGIIEEHGGKIRVESEGGKGTTFIISLPVL